MVIQNDCTPAAVFGGFTQTLFLGCSVASFSVSAGFNEQIDEITIQIVQDLCSASKTYWDSSLTQQTHGGADPGFIGHDTDIIGCPVYFRVGDFEFAGILQSWQQIDQHAVHATLPVKGWEYGNAAIPNNGLTAYQVKLINPAELLENCQIIINEYAGGVLGIDNIANVFGYLENIYPICSAQGIDQGIDGRIFGTPFGGFGGANTDNNGIGWNQVMLGARVLFSGASTEFSNGYISFRGADANVSTPSGMGLIGQSASTSGETHYIVDIQEMPLLPNAYKIDGLSVSLLSVISDVCQKAGYDYYIELLPVDASSVPSTVRSSNGIACVIKIRTVNRNAQPTIGRIQDFVDDAIDGTKSNSVGLELRNETTTQMIVGGFKQNVFDTSTIASFTDPEGDGDPANPEADDMIVPYFGLDPVTGNAILPWKNVVTGRWEFSTNTIELTNQLAIYDVARWGLGGTHALPEYITITEPELQAALVSFDQYVYVAGMLETDMNTAMTFSTTFNQGFMTGVMENFANIGGQLAPRDPRLNGDALLKHLNILAGKRIMAGYQTAYEFVKRFASEYYGKKFQVRVPYVCSRIPQTSIFSATSDGEVFFTDSPSDAGWSELPLLLNMANPSYAVDFFRKDDMRIGAVLRFPNLNQLNINKLSRDDYIGDIDNNVIYIRADIEPEWVLTDRSIFPPVNQMAIRAVLSIPDLISDGQTDAGGYDLVGALEKLAIDNSVLHNQGAHLANARGKVGGQMLNLPYQYKMKMPDGALVPTKSNVLTYGPYVAGGPAGGAVIQHEEGLVPWEYGDYATMNAVGEELATAGITNMQYGEEGTVTVPGYPAIPLHAELLALSPGGRYYGGSSNLFESRSISNDTDAYGTYYYINMGGEWDGTDGPNITGVTVQVGEGGLETTYSMRTYTFKFGKFAKLNSDRLKKIGQNSMRTAKMLRHFTYQRNKIRAR